MRWHAISSSNPRFIGISQGSVLGGTFLTQSPDIDRGALIVGGANFSFMIERSIHFNTYETFLMPAYGKRLVTAQLMAISCAVTNRFPYAGIRNVS